MTNAPAFGVEQALAHAEYRKSSRSSASGECVTVGRAAGWVGIRDSKDGGRTTLAATGRQWAALIAAIRAGQLDVAA